MYWFKTEYKEEFDILKRKVYIEILGVSGQTLINIFCGKRPCPMKTAKGLISIRFDISLRDTRINEYLEKYFTEEEK